MSNERLQKAMDAANIDIDSIVEKMLVDPRTVERWVKGRIPHLRYRKLLAKLLNEHEGFLWPENGSAIAEVPTQTGEIVADYAHRAEVPADVWWRMFSKAESNIDLLGYAMIFLPELFPDLPSLLINKSHTGCKTRIALANPTSRFVQLRDNEERLGGTLAARIQTTLYHFRPLLDYPDIEIRFHETPLYCSIFRFDTEMFVTPHLYGLHGSKAPLFHVQRLGPRAHFANYLTCFEEIWATTIPLTYQSSKTESQEYIYDKKRLP